MKRDDSKSISLIKIVCISLIVLFITGITINVTATNTSLNTVKIKLSNNYEMTVITNKTNISDILNENHIIVPENEIVVPSLDSELSDNNTIVISKNTENINNELAKEEKTINIEDVCLNYNEIIEKIIVEDVVIPYETITKDVSKGSDTVNNNIVQRGSNGLKTVTYKVKYQNDVEIERIEIDSVIKKEPVNKIVEVVKKSPTTRGNVDRANTDSEVMLLAKLIKAEAAANSETDQKYVGVVIMNRVSSSYFPNSISGVIYQKGQYACTGKLSSINPTDNMISIAQEIINGERYGVPSNVLFQAQFKQGNGVFQKVGVHYYCYK